MPESLNIILGHNLTEKLCQAWCLLPKSIYRIYLSFLELPVNSNKKYFLKNSS